MSASKMVPFGTVAARGAGAAGVRRAGRVWRRHERMARFAELVGER